MSRTTVLKTYKLWVGGAFVRSESGRAYPVRNAQGELTRLKAFERRAT